MPNYFASILRRSNDLYDIRVAETELREARQASAIDQHAFRIALRQILAIALNQRCHAVSTLY